MSISIDRLNAGYDGFRLTDISAKIPAHSFTALIGPNGCGKSTLLKTIVRLLPMRSGRIDVAGLDIARSPARKVARLISVLSQYPVAPPAVTVAQMVAYGRAPHQNFFGMMSENDKLAVSRAIGQAGLADLADKRMEALSGGQRQRAFLAMCIAQDTPYVLFDEPTSFLDIRYQYEILDLIKALNKVGKTCVAVLHDIGQAARYADHLIVMRAGAVIAQGSPDEIIDEALLHEVYGVNAMVYGDPVTGTKLISARPG